MASNSAEPLLIPASPVENSISTCTSLELSAIVYAQLYGLFVPLHRLDPISYIEVERDHSYWPLDAEDDGSLEPFHIRHVAVVEDEAEVNGYAEHVVTGDITPVDGDSITSFMYTILEHAVKFPVPILHATSTRDMAQYLRVRAKFRAFDFDDFVLPHEPTNDEKDEGVVFPQDSALYLAALEGDTESEQLSINMVETKHIDDLLSEIQCDEPLETELKPVMSRRIRIISPPISPVVRPIEPFVPWQEVSRIGTPDSDIASLLEADLSAAEAAAEKIFYDDEQYPDPQNTLDLALRFSSSVSKSPTPSAHPFHIKIDPPVLRPMSPLDDSALFAIDLKAELNFDARFSPSSSPHKTESEGSCAIVLDHDLKDICHEKAQSVDMVVSQERLNYHDVAIRMTAPVLDFSRPNPSWYAIFPSALQCAKHVMQLFSAIFDVSRIKFSPDISPSDLTWRPWPSMKTNFNMKEAFEYDFELLRDILASNCNIENDDLWNRAPKLSFLGKSSIEDDIDICCLPDRLDVPGTLPLDASTASIPETPQKTPPSRHTSKFFSSSSVFEQSSPSILANHIPSNSKDHAFLVTPKTSSPVKPKPPKVGILVPKKRDGSLLDDILALKRSKKLPTVATQTDPGSLLAPSSQANLAGQHLTNFMNVMNLPGKKTSKCSKFFSGSSSAPDEQSPTKDILFTKRRGHDSVDIGPSPTLQTRPLPFGTHNLVGSCVVSISLGLKFIRLIRKLQPRINLIDRDYSRYSVTAKDAISGLIELSPAAISYEADISISPTTGLVVISLASFAESKVKTRLQHVSRLYDQLIILVSQRSLSSEMSMEDVTAYARISSFAASLPNTTRSYLIDGDDESMANWTIKFLSDCQKEIGRVSGLLSADEHSWERLFRLCGLNVCAAQALAKTLEYQYGKKGLMAFMKMDMNDRIPRFAALLGSKRRLEILSTRLFQKWT